MPPNSEIDKLERRWKDNPKGTGFAPYAEALRKQGDLELAREVLRQGLEIHPDHIPGNIVLGRCCLDLAEDEPAEAAFRHVLDLDVENVIALKALADITERQGRLAEAVDWLTRLVASDPNNDEAVAHLARVEASRVAAAAAGSRPLTESGAHVRPPMPEAPPALMPAVPAPEPVTATLEPPVAAPVPEPVTGVVESPVEAAHPSPASVSDPALEGPVAEEAAPELPPSPEMADAPTIEMEPVPREHVVEEVPGLLVSEISMHAAGATGLVVEGMERDEPPTLEAEDVAGLSRVEGLTGSGTFVMGVDKEDDFELASGAGGEFQAPDDSSALGTITPSGSEFQTPDAALELSPSQGGGTEFQAADASAELAESVPPPAAAPGYGIDLGLPEAGLEEPPSVVLPPVAAIAEPEPESAELPMERPVPPESASAPLPAAPPALPDVGARTGELRLIFPEEAEQPEKHKVRRISQETPAITIPAAAEPVIREPEPVMTESMAELYARQGHQAEALKVYRALAAQQPGEERFRDRIRELEAAQAPKPRRAGVAAVETGGESVESFFRSLASARPGLMGLAAAAAERGQPEGKGAPTRPASDPLSLSAIFGEEPARTQPPPPPEPPAPQATDAFSFDQFFGKPAPEPSRPSTESGRPSEDDLDQFQNWLKGLKR